jgi:hypothetical protein
MTTIHRLVADGEGAPISPAHVLLAVMAIFSR